MNKPIRGAEPPTQLAEDQIADFLVAHPDFFERHGAVLARIKLPHQRGSAAISLVERQVLVLRDKHAVLEKKLHELIENGRANDAISDRLHRLTRRLLRARDAAGVVAALETSLREDFGASRWVLLATDPAVSALGNLQNGARARRAARQPRTEDLRDVLRVRAAAQRPDPRHAARLPLRRRRQPGRLDRADSARRARGLGLLAIASHDTERYLPTMSTDYLVRIGEIVTEAVSARLA